MSQSENGTQRKKIWIGICLYAILFFLVIFITNLPSLNKWVSSVLSIFRPVLIGLVTAYLVNPVFRFLERKILFRVRPQPLRRALALLLTFIFCLLLILLLFALIIPQLVASFKTFYDNVPDYLAGFINRFNAAIEWINGLLAGVTHNEETFAYLSQEMISASMTDLITWFTDVFIVSLKDKMTTSAISEVLGVAGSIIAVITDIIFGIFVAIYLLASKEKRYAQVMKFRRALFHEEANKRITKFLTIADRSFGGFLEGKIVDSLIIGILTYIVILIFRIPYPVLIAMIVGITNVIPVIGPLIGAIPTALIILLTEPSKTIAFIIIIILIQQIDGNIIGPKILGSNTGVSSLCVLIAITTMGTLWGFTGMVVGVPLFATILELTNGMLERKLQQKGLPTGTENYYPADSQVNPSKDLKTNTDKSLRAFENKVLRIRKNMDSSGSGNLNGFEKFQLNVYDLARKYHIFSEITDETMAEFAAEEAAIVAAEEAKRNLAAELEAVKVENEDPQAAPAPDESAGAVDGDNSVPAVHELTDDENEDVK